MLAALALARILGAPSFVVSVATDNRSSIPTPVTLGDLLYADPVIACSPEKDWLTLIRAIAGGEELALRALFEKTYPLVSTYLMRMTGDRQMTEDLILEVFEGIWCEAPVFDSTSTSVLGWIMRQARTRASAHVSGGNPLEHSTSRVVASLQSERAATTDRPMPTNRSLQLALEDLTVEEREILEAALIGGLPYAELAAARGESVGSIKSRLRSALAKLRRSLEEGVGDA
jgi:RNA polymerase sigma-70 factor (ECF subfamily)